MGIVLRSQGVEKRGELVVVNGLLLAEDGDGHPVVRGSLTPLTQGTGTGIVSVCQEVAFHASGADLDIVGVEAPLTEMSPRSRTWFNAVGFTRVRLVAQIGTAATSGTLVVAQYSYDGGTSWRYLDGASGPTLRLDQTGMIRGPWATLEPTAQGDILLRWATYGGDGTTTPVLGKLALELDVVSTFVGDGDDPNGDSGDPTGLSPLAWHLATQTAVASRSSEGEVWREDFERYAGAGDSGGAPVDFGPSTTTIPGGAVTIAPGTDIQSVVDAHAAGTVFVLGAGTHVRQSVVPKSNMQFFGAPGAIMEGGQTLTGWTSDGSGHWYVTGQTHGGFAMSSGTCITGYPRCQYPDQLWIDGTLQRPVSSLATMTAGTWFYDYTADRIYLPSNPSTSTVVNSVTEQAFVGSATGVVLDGLTMQHYRPEGLSKGVVDCGTGWVVRNCTIQDNAMDAVSVTTDCLVSHCLLTRNGNYGVTASGGTDVAPVTGILIEFCEVSYNNTQGITTGFGAGGCKMVYTQGCTWNSNWVHHNLGSGIWYDINNVDGVVSNNLVTDNAIQGIFIEISFGATIFGNTVTGNGFGRGNSAGFGAGILVAASPDVEIFNNYVSGNHNAITALQQDRSADQPSARGPHEIENLYVHDNVVSPGAAQSGLFVGVGDTTYFTSRNNRWQHNTYYVDNLSDKAFAWNGSSKTWTEWKAAGQDTSGNATVGTAPAPDLTPSLPEWSAAWTESDPTDSVTWSVDGTHTTSGSKALLLTVTDPVTPGTRYEVQQVVTDLTPNALYALTYQVYAIGGTPSFGENAFAGQSLSVITTASGEATVALGLEVPAGGMAVGSTWWFDDARLVRNSTVTTSSEGLATWADLTEHANNLIVVDPEGVPTLTGDPLNGSPTVRFADSIMQWPTALYEGRSAGEAFVVFKQRGVPGTEYLWRLGTGADPTTVGAEAQDNFGSSVTHDAGAAGVDDERFHLWNVRASLTDWSATLDGELLFATSGTSVAFAATPVFGGSGTSQPATIDVAEVVLFDRVLSDTERNTVHSGMNNRWDLGLPVVVGLPPGGGGDPPPAPPGALKMYLGSYDTWTYSPPFYANLAGGVYGSANDLLQELTLHRAGGMTMIWVGMPHSAGEQLINGQRSGYNHAKALAYVRMFASAAAEIQSYFEDGTLHPSLYLIDEPSCTNCWHGTTPTPQQVDELAFEYRKFIPKDMGIHVRLSADALLDWYAGWQYITGCVNVYKAPSPLQPNRPTITEYIQTMTALMKPRGWRAWWNLNMTASGDGSSGIRDTDTNLNRMAYFVSAQEVATYGVPMAQLGKDVSVGMGYWVAAGDPQEAPNFFTAEYLAAYNKVYQTLIATTG